MVNHRLLAACRDNDIGALKLALDEGAFLETRQPFVMRPTPPSAVVGMLQGGFGGQAKKRQGPKVGLTPLMYAAQNGSMAFATLLLDAKAQVCARDEDGLRPLHFAASSGNSEVCALFISRGGDKNAMDDDGRRAIDYVPSLSSSTKIERERWEALLGAVSPDAVPLPTPPLAVSEVQLQTAPADPLPSEELKATEPELPLSDLAFR